MVADAVERYVAELRRRGVLGAVADAVGAAAVAVARDLDDPSTSATARAAGARALRELLDRLGELVPEEQVGDQLDELGARREKRIAGSAGA